MSHLPLVMSAIKLAQLVLTHSAGAVVRLCADGSIYSRGEWHHDGGLRVNGNVYAELNITAKLDVLDLNGAHGTMAFFRTQYDVHGHTQPPDSRGDTEALTNPPDHLV